jgi:hypothetical protein
MHTYAVNPSVPGGLLVSAIPILLKDISATSYKIAGPPSYGVTAAKREEWRASRVLNDRSNWLRSPTLVPHDGAFALFGKRFPVRCKEPIGSGLGYSADRRIFVVLCVSTGFYTFDVFDGIAGAQLASVELRHDLGEDRVQWVPSYVQFLENRWLAISLDQDLREILLFDFEPHFSGKASK